MKKKSSLFRILSGTRKKFSDFQMKMNHIKNQREERLNTSAVIPRSPHKDAQKVVVEVSAGTVAKATAVILLLLLLLFFLFQISGILLILFVSFLLAAALDPIVDFMQKRKIPRSLGVVIIYVVFFCLLGFSLSNIVPIVAKQVIDIGKSVADFVQNLTRNSDDTTSFITQFKPLLKQLYQAVNLQTAAGQIQTALQVVAAQLLSISFGLMNVLLVLVLTFFMNVEEDALHDFFLSMFPSRYGDYISTRMEAVKEKIGAWLRGQLLLSLVGGIITYIGLLILNVQYALTLSVIAGILLVIPVFGRFFALIFTLPVVINQSPLLAVWVSIFYVVLQQIEINFLVPYIMNKVVGLSPIIIIFVMLVGSQYLGVLGLVISIPVATSVAIFVKDYMEKAK